MSHPVLRPMTKALSRAFWDGFSPDPAVYEHPEEMQPYTFRQEDAEARYDQRLAK